MLKYKIIVVGQKNVGKTSLIRRYTENIFRESPQPTNKLAFRRKIVTSIMDIMRKINIELSIWDFGGEEKYKLLLPAYAHAASAALFLYDITNKDTLLDIDNWVKIIDNNAPSNVFKLLIATKLDLEYKRQVSMGKAVEYCRANNYTWCSNIIETSSKTGENIKEVFLQTAQELVERNLQTCEICGGILDRKLRVCRYCGKETKIKPV